MDGLMTSVRSHDISTKVYYICNACYLCGAGFSNDVANYFEKELAITFQDTENLHFTGSIASTPRFLVVANRIAEHSERYHRQERWWDSRNNPLVFTQRRFAPNKNRKKIGP